MELFIVESHYGEITILEIIILKIPLEDFFKNSKKQKINSHYVWFYGAILYLWRQKPMTTMCKIKKQPKATQVNP